MNAKGCPCLVGVAATSTKANGRHCAKAQKEIDNVQWIEDR